MAKGPQETHRKKCQDILVGQYFNGEMSYGELDPGQDLGALDLGQQTHSLFLFHKSSFSFFGASAGPMEYSSPLVSATCPGRF